MGEPQMGEELVLTQDIVVRVPAGSKVTYVGTHESGKWTVHVHNPNRTNGDARPMLVCAVDPRKFS